MRLNHSYLLLPWLLLCRRQAALIPTATAFIHHYYYTTSDRTLVHGKHQLAPNFVPDPDDDDDTLVVDSQQEQQQHHPSWNVPKTSRLLLLQQQQQGRRELLRQSMGGSTSFILLSSLLLPKPPCWASFDEGSTTKNNFIPPESVKYPTGLLESRVVENVYSYPPYGLECADIYYPSWFSGTWQVASTTTSVEAPLGRAFFAPNNNATYQAALDEIGTTLRYESRFIIASAMDAGGSRRSSSVSSSNGNNNYSNDDDDDNGPSITPTLSSASTVIADRGYNVESIATAALGRNSVVNLPLVSANKLTAILAPLGAPNPLRVDLFTVSRRQEYVNATHFHCSEVVREIVSSIGNSKDGNANGRSSSTTSSMPTILKEVETTTLYTLVTTNDPKNPYTIRGRQRSAKFLVPTQNDAASFRLYEMTRRQPVDVRFYDVVYTKKNM